MCKYENSHMNNKPLRFAQLGINDSSVQQDERI